MPCGTASPRLVVAMRFSTCLGYAYLPVDVGLDLAFDVAVDIAVNLNY
jgi:hypothetical protein